MATVLDSVLGQESVRIDFAVSTQAYMHASAAGKAILPSLPEERANDIIDKCGLKRFTQNTITDRSRLFAELEEHRPEGVYYGRKEYREGLSSIDVPITTGDDVLGAITVMGPSRRLEEEMTGSDLKDRLLVTANAIEVNLDSM